jgi:dienelactone hydrolase
MGVEGPLAGAFDVRRLGAFGHSLGGNAALEFCRTDERCRAAVNLDGANWSDVGRIGLAKPALILAAEHPEMEAPPEGLVAAGVYPDLEWALAERAVLFDGWQKVVETGRPGLLHTIEGARHANFADLQFVALPEDSPLRGGIGPVEPRLMWRDTCDQLLAFFGEHLRA